jgi:hypothetical protein
LETTLDSKRKKTALPSAVAVGGKVRVNRPVSRLKRALAVENPQAFPEVSASQQLADLESPEVYDEE